MPHSFESVAQMIPARNSQKVFFLAASTSQRIVKSCSRYFGGRSGVNRSRRLRRDRNHFILLQHRRLSRTRLRW